MFCELLLCAVCPRKGLETLVHCTGQAKSWALQHVPLLLAPERGARLLLTPHCLVCRREACNEGEGDPPLYVNVNMFSGQLMNTWIDSLQAFFPGLQVRSCSGSGRPAVRQASVLG